MNDPNEHASSEETMSTAQTVFKDEKERSTLGLDENIGGMLCYIFIIGLIFLIIEKDNRFIRFHALQAVFLGVFLFIVGLILGAIPIIGVLLGLLWTPVVLALMVFMMIQAYKEKYYKLPIIGDLAEKQLK